MSKTKRKPAPKAPKAPRVPVDRSLVVNQRNGALESDCIYIDGVLCDKRSRLPV